MPTTYTPDSWASNPKYKQPTANAPLVQQGPGAQRNALMSYANRWIQQGPGAVNRAAPMTPIYTGGGGGSSIRNNNFAPYQPMQQQQQQIPSWAMGMQGGWNLNNNAINNMQAGSMATAQPIAWAGSPTTSAVQWAGAQKQGAYKDDYKLQENAIQNLLKAPDPAGTRNEKEIYERTEKLKAANDATRNATSPFIWGDQMMADGSILPAINGIKNFDIPVPAVDSLPDQTQNVGYPYPQYPWWLFGGGGGGGGYYSNSVPNWVQGLVNWRI